MSKNRRQKVDESLQPPLLGLFDELDKKPGKAISWPVSNEDIGGELLSILSRGLYPSPLDCVREYVQNAVDALARTVSIKVTGNSVIIHDDGEGMTLEGLVDARKFGISPKAIGEFVGFRGIGIYSGFDICNRLIIDTKRSGELQCHILEFDFQGMRTQLDAERKSPQSGRTPLNELITTYSSFRREDIPQKHVDKSYSIVQLENLSDAHIGQLADRVELRKYILRNLPIDFADGFEYKAKISKALRENIPGYNAVIIQLEVDNAPIETISRPAIAHLGEPKLDFIANSKREPIAYYWACLHNEGRQIPDEYKDYQGFVYKVKGFTIGDNEKLREYFKIGSGTLYRWYTGEIYILDPNVIPNAARDDFESNRAKVQLVTAVKDTLEDLQKIASQYQQRLRAEKTLAESAQKLEQIENKVNSGQHYDEYDEHTNLDNLIRELEKQKKFADRQIVTSLIQRAERFKKTVRKAIDNPQEPAKRVSPPEPTVVPPPTPPTGVPPYMPQLGEQTQPLSPSEGGTTPIQSEGDQPSLFSTPPESPRVQTLLGLLIELGLEFPEGFSDLLQLIDAALADVLGYESKTYKQVLETLETRITEIE